MNRKFYFLMGMLFIAFTSFSQVLDQSNAPENIGGAIFSISSTNSVGQSFTAGVTGNLSQINIRILNISGTFTPGDLQLRVLSGDGYAGTVLNTTTIEVLTVGDQFTYQELVIPLSENVPVTAGSTYILDLQFSGNVETLALTGDPYPRGILYTNNSASNSNDLWFKTFVTADPSTHLNFDGVDDYVELPDVAELSFSVNLTVEFWMKSNANPNNFEILVADGEAGFGLLLNADGTIMLGAEGEFINSTSTLTDGEWHHVAGTFFLDGNETSLKLYIDGTLDQSVILNGLLFLNDPSTPVFIGGSVSGPANNFNGSMDDLHFWNTALTASEISTNIECELSGVESNLVAYYKFNQGLGSQDNSSITSLTDETASGLDGVLSGFALTGTSSNFLTDVDISSPSEPIVTTPVNYTLGDTATPLTATTNTTTLVWYEVMTGGSALAGAPTPSTTTVGETSYWVSSINSRGCESARTEIVVNVNPVIPATHLNFDGVNDYVELTTESSFDFTNQMTIEFWMKSDYNPTQWDAIMAKGDDSWRIALNQDGTLNFAGSNAFGDVSSVSSVIDNSWHHVAVTYNNVEAIIYIDGIQNSNVIGTGNINNSNFPVSIGQNLQVLGRFYQGNIDEVRIWDVARTAEQIESSKNCELEGTEAGLVAYYKFNQGLGSQDNSSITSLTDETASGLDGVLSGFALTSTTSNFISGSTITSVPTAPTAAAQTFNLSATVADLIPAPSTSIQWYNVATGGAALEANTALTTGTYYVSENNANDCESQRTAVNITVNTTPDAPLATSPQIYAGEGTVANLTATGANLKWYATETAETVLESTAVLVNGSTYYVSQTINGIESDRTAVVVNKISDAEQVFCEEATLEDLITTPTEGTTTQWFTDATSGSALESTEALTTGTYYVEQSNPFSVTTLGSEFSSPNGVAVQADGKIIVVDSQNNLVKRMNADGSGVEILGSDFNYPRAVAVQSDGKIIIADSNNNEIKRMDNDGSNIVVLGSGFSDPFDVVLQEDGKILIADSVNAIKRMDADGSNVVTLSTDFSFSASVAVRADGKILVADFFNNAIKQMNADGSNIETLDSSFSNPRGVTVQADGKIIVADSGNNTIKRMDADGSNIVTLASNFSSPRQLAIQANGAILVADLNNNAIKRITEATLSNRVAINVVVNSLTTPTFEPVSICNGETPEALPTTSEEGITGTWSPELNNTATTTYNFTPTDGQCASTTTLEIAVNELPVITANGTESKCEFGSLILEPTVNDPNAQSADGFVGGFAEDNWTQFAPANSNGSIAFTESSVTMIASNTGSGNTTTNSAYITMPYNATVSFDWNYTSGDIASGDLPLIGTNSGDLSLFNGYSTEGTSSQSGVHNISIQAGNNLLLAINSNDTNGSSTITISNFQVTPSSTYLWEASNGGEIFGATNELNLAVDVAGTYTLTVTNPSGCSASKSIDVSVTESPAPVADANQVFCSGATVNQLQAESENLIWYNSDFDELSGTTTLLSGTYFVSQTVGTCESDVTEVVVTVNALPAAPTLPTQQLCFDASVADLPVSEINDVVYNWFDTATGDTALSNDTTLSTGTYYVSAFDELTLCESQRMSIQLNVSSELTATLVSQINISCNGLSDGSATVEVSGGTAPYTYLWSNGSTSSMLSGVPSGVYNLFVTDANGCGSTTSVMATVNITEPAVVEVPFVGDQTFCGNTIVADLQGQGNSLKWYLEVDDVVALSNTANVTTGTYYVSQTVNGCESERTAVAVNISVVPDAPIADAQTFCGSATVADLDATGTDLGWYTDVSTPFPLNPTESINSGTYYVSEINLDGCESERTAVQVTVNSIPEPTINYNTNTQSLETEVFETYQWYLEGNLIVGATDQTYLPTSTGIYTVVVTNNNCEGESIQFNLSTLSLRNFDLNIGLYPNPASSKITVNFSRIGTHQVELQMYDLTGKLVKSSHLNETVQTIDVSTLSEGVYLFRFIGPGVNETRKVIIKK